MRLYIYLLYLVAKCFVKSGKYLSSMWPRTALYLSKTGLDIYIYRNKLYAEYYDIPKQKEPTP